MPNPPRKDDVLVFTSSNGVEHFCALTDRRDWPVLTVGDVTAHSAKENGFSDIKSAGKNVHKLTALIARDIVPSVRLYYPSAADIAVDLAGELEPLGYKVERAVSYKTLPNPDLPTKAADYILLYSQKGARALVRSGIEIDRATLISISKSVDKALGNSLCRARLWAEHPNHNSMLKLLDRP